MGEGGGVGFSLGPLSDLEDCFCRVAGFWKQSFSTKQNTRDEGMVEHARHPFVQLKSPAKYDQTGLLFHSHGAGMAHESRNTNRVTSIRDAADCVDEAK